MPNKPKYEKLVKGERKAVRQTGARKEAKKGIITEIYTAQKGGGLITANKREKGKISTPEGAVSLQGRTVKEKLKPVVGSQEQKAAQFERQAQINQAQFEKTRLGNRLKRKAEKAAAKSGTQAQRKLGRTTFKNQRLK